jgi:hypothetical protein
LKQNCPASTIEAIAKPLQVEVKAYNYASIPCRLFDMRLPIETNYEDEASRLIDAMRDDKGVSLIQSITLYPDIGDKRICYYCGLTDHEIYACPLKDQDFKESRAQSQKRTSEPVRKVWRPVIRAPEEKEMQPDILHVEPQPELYPANDVKNAAAVEPRDALNNASYDAEMKQADNDDTTNVAQLDLTEKDKMSPGPNRHSKRGRHR